MKVHVSQKPVVEGCRSESGAVGGILTRSSALLIPFLSSLLNGNSSQPVGTGWDRAGLGTHPSSS